ncbi:MAG: VCBS repeat-containing protein [Bacteroidetes bacterium]|nr:VCBS repeat-containing protein [Bacteroidota bacterium]
MKTTTAHIAGRGVWLFVLLVFSLASAAQTISGFSPASGPVGTVVTITGTGFNATPSNNIVFFGATTATVTSASATSLSVTVPSGANYQYITVTNLTTNLTAYSAKPFVVTTSCSSTSSFASAVSVQGGSHNIEICDMDGDGKPDLIIPDYFNNYLTVTRNTSTPGTISFAPKVTIAWAAGGQPNEVSIGDFDGDGKPDVALGGNGGGSIVSVYRNTSTAGNISFATRQDFTASSGQGNGNRIADIDGDGKPDLLSVHWSGNCLWVLRNTSTGSGVISFASGVSFATTAQPHKIDVGDLDGDGKPDVVITAFTSNALSIFRNISTVGSISFATRQDFSPGTVPYFVHVGDLDGDGKPDIAITDRDLAILAVYRNTSSSGSISLASRQDFATPSGTMTHYGVAFGDIDGDGKPDIAVGNYTLNKVSVFRNSSVSGTISFDPRVDLTSGVAYDVGIDDFDGDGRPDIATTNSGTTVSIIRNICTLLPIELISFSAAPKNNGVELRWSTASELNNDHFTVERSGDGLHFESIGEVKGAGTSVSQLNYLFYDSHPLPGENYYRLKQTDFDGSFTYSAVQAIDLTGETGSPEIFPNPFNEVLILRGTSPYGMANIFDITGKEILRTRTSAGQTMLNTASLPSGIYYVGYSCQSSTKIFRVVK